MANISNILPSIKYATEPGAQLKLDFTPKRIISGRFKIRPRSQYEQKLLTAALMNGKSSIILNSDPNQQFSVGGVKVISKRFSHLSHSSDSSPTDESPGDGSKFRYSSSQSEVNTAAALCNQSTSPSCEKSFQDATQVYQSSRTSLKREKSANMIKQKYSKTISLNKSNNQNNISKGKAAIFNRRLSKDSSRKSQSRKSLVLNGSSPAQPKLRPAAAVVEYKAKPDFDTSNTTKTVKVFLSQKQSPNISSSVTPRTSNLTHPSAPPCTPGPEHKKKYEYIPSLSDNLAKQQVKTKLKVIKKIESDKEKIRQSDRMKIELKVAKEREHELRKLQRRAIYQLNTEMTRVENEQFEDFKKNNGLRPKEYPSPNVKLK